VYSFRLAHAAMGKREKQRLAAQQAAGGEAAAAADASAAERDFTKLTELADLLLNAGGELDVYSHRKEQLQRWADAVLPQTNVLAGARDGQALHESSTVRGQSCGLCTTGRLCVCCWQGKRIVGRICIGAWHSCTGLWCNFLCCCVLHAGGDDDDDMFASDEEQDKAKKQPAATPKQQQDGQQQQPQEQPAAAAAQGADGSAADPSSAAAAAPAAAPAAAAAVDTSAWPVKELRRFLTERGVDSSSIVEKQELVDAVSAGGTALHNNVCSCRPSTQLHGCLC
jgi:CD2 antigen cytoplasmic tail-binding protein 2